jgi:hypothetical protein
MMASLQSNPAGGTPPGGRVAAKLHASPSRNGGTDRSSGTAQPAVLPAQEQIRGRIAAKSILHDKLPIHAC